MIDDRVSFAKKATSVESFGLANEICILKYFNELMAFYNLIEDDKNTLMTNTIENYWFDDNNQKFNMILEFKNVEHLNNFCNNIQYCYGGKIFIYGMFYNINYNVDLNNNSCRLYLDLCKQQQNPS